MNIPIVIKDPDIPLHSITRAFISIIFSFAIACFAGDSFADDFTDAVRSFKNQQYRQALSLFEEGASKQDPRSEYALGLLYQNGVIVKKDTRRGLELITKAANHGFRPGSKLSGSSLF